MTATRLPTHSAGGEGIVEAEQSAAALSRFVESRQEIVIAEVCQRATWGACPDSVAGTRPYCLLAGEVSWKGRRNLFDKRGSEIQEKHCASGHSASRLPFAEDWQIGQRQQD